MADGAGAVAALDDDENVVAVVVGVRVRAAADLRWRNGHLEAYTETVSSYSRGTCVDCDCIGKQYHRFD